MSTSIRNFAGAPGTVAISFLLQGRGWNSRDASPDGKVTPYFWGRLLGWGSKSKCANSFLREKSTQVSDLATQQELRWRLAGEIPMRQVFCCAVFLLSGVALHAQV